VETTLHVLRDCPIVHKIWLEFVPWQYVGELFLMNLSRWLNPGLTSKERLNFHQEYSIIFGVGVWHIWQWRNKSLFQDYFVFPLNSVQVIQSCTEKIIKTSLVDNSMLSGSCTSSILVR